MTTLDLSQYKDVMSFTGKSVSYLNKQIKRYQTLGYRTVKTHKHPDGGTTVTLVRN